MYKYSKKGGAKALPGGKSMKAYYLVGNAHLVHLGLSFSEGFDIGSEHFAVRLNVEYLSVSVLNVSVINDKLGSTKVCIGLYYRGSP